MQNHDDEEQRFSEIRSFYDSIYYKSANPDISASRHLTMLAHKVGVQKDQQVLDVACGVGEWLLACKEIGAHVNGVDLSEKAIAICNKNFPEGMFYSVSAESLPFEDNKFDFVTCLGALEHFLDPGKALKEMLRVAKDNAKFLLLVPNSGFLTRRLGLFSGTNQADVKEDIRSLEEWKNLFETSGLTVNEMWKDLHVLSWLWISSRGWLHVPVRAAQAFALTIWPLKWQYQVYYFCVAKN